MLSYITALPHALLHAIILLAQDEPAFDLTAIAVGFLSLLGTISLAFSTASKRRVEELKDHVKELQDLADDLRDRFDVLESDIKAKNLEIKKLRRRVEQLVKFIKQLGYDPPPDNGEEE